jgi:tetratricopeptide (TPR) repeat protein
MTVGTHWLPSILTAPSAMPSRTNLASVQSASLHPDDFPKDSVVTTDVFTHGFSPLEVVESHANRVSSPSLNASSDDEMTVVQGRTSRAGLTWVERGYGLYRLSNYREAIVCFDTAIEFDPHLVDAWQGKGICLGEQNESEGAIACFERVILIDPNNYRGWHNRGNALMRANQYEEVMACFKRVLQLKPENYKARYNRGLCLGNLHHLDQAIHSFDQALSLKPDCYYGWSGRGHTLSRMQRYDEAIHAFDRSIDLHPKNFPAWYGKATAYAGSRKVLHAIDSLSQAMIYAPQAVWKLAQHDPAFSHIRHEAAFQSFFGP